MHKKTDLIAIATHEHVYGAPQALREYLENTKQFRVAFLAHPLLDSKGESYLEISGDRFRAWERRASGTVYPIIGYVKNIYRNLRWLSSIGIIDIFFGVNPLNAFSGIVLRRFAKVNKVIYYTIDFTPKRFNFAPLNYLYHLADKYCVTHADEVWNVSNQIQVGREHRDGALSRSQSNVYTVPIGVWCDRIKKIPFELVNKHQAFFLGHLLEKQGVQLLLNATPKILEKHPNFRFVIIGGGDYELSLKKLAKSLCIEHAVEFKGWVYDRTILDDVMCTSAFGVATYISKIAEFTAFADPTKLKDYLSAGLPLLMTDVPHNSSELVENNCAIITNEDPNEIANKVIALLDNQNIMKLMRESALNYIQKFDWNLIFKHHLSRLIYAK